MKTYIQGKIIGILPVIYLAVLFSLTMIIEQYMSGFTIVGLGFVPGLSLAITGMIHRYYVKDEFCHA